MTEKELEKALQETYKQAMEEVTQKTKDFWQSHYAIEKKMRQKMQDGEITKAQYQTWMRNQIFTGKRWQKKFDDITKVYTNADEKARKIINGERINIFVESANHTAYEIEKDFQGGVSFDLYDAKSVERLIKDDPKMLPEWKIDEPKDYLWNEKRVQNAVAQGIIQGESVYKIAERLESDLSTKNAKKMRLFARTANTGAQNAGRIDRMHQAQKMGIEVKKQWLCIHDARTRDQHLYLDGQVEDVDKPFKVDGDKINYPGDPTAPPRLVYNCFVGETSAYANCEIERSYKHEYTGDLVNVETATGIYFSCTPNHPILTDRGWVHAASLHNGDNLIVTRVRNGFCFWRNSNIKHVLSSMETFHNSFKSVGLASRNSPLSVNFHGDIPTSEVEIVGKKRFLPNDRNSCSSKHVKKFLLKLSNKSFSCKRSFVKHIRGISFSALCFIRSKSKFFPIIRRCLGHAQEHGLRPIALFDSGTVQAVNNNISGNIEVIGNCLNGFSGIVLSDNIVSINKCPCSTHVYNLQTENGYYFVNTNINDPFSKANDFAVISHNCRCTLSYVYPKHQSIKRWEDQLTGEEKEWKSYSEWKAEKQGQKEEKQETKINYAVKTIEYGDLFPKEAQEITKSTIQQLQNEFPLTFNLDYVGDVRTHRNIGLDDDVIDLHYNHKELTPCAAQYLPDGVGDGKPCIEIHKEDCGTESLKEEFQERYALRKKQGIDINTVPDKVHAFYEVSSSLEGTIMHEYGHALADSYGVFNAGRENSYKDWEWKFWENHKEELPALSLYAASHPDEMFAEAFVQYHDKEHTDTLAYKLASEIIETFIKYTKGG